MGMETPFMNSSSSERVYKYLNTIIFLDITMMAIVNVISGKIIQISIFTLSAASLCIPVTYIFGDIFTEVYGYRQARRATWILLLSTMVTAVVFQLAAWLPPAPGFVGNDAYSLVLKQVPRIVIGAWTALFAGQFINDFVLAKMKVLTSGKYLWMRTIGSTMAGQAVDTACFYVIALYTIIPTGLLLHSIVSAWVLKVMIEVLMTPITYYAIGTLKRAENEDYYDKNTNFNPLILKISE
ncbi:MAG: hypothetical protein JWM56_1330 [Candidatus Peribacteria bacterium]|nr:hypothetical protein [Candidatus Peribacteria bacterium]